MCRYYTLWVKLKAANNSPIQTLGVIQEDIKIWGRTVKKRGWWWCCRKPWTPAPCYLRLECFAGGGSADSLGARALILEVITKQELDPGHQCRTQAQVAELGVRIGKVQVTPSLPIKIEVRYEVVLSLLVGSHYNLQGVTMMVEPMLQQECVTVGCTVCKAETGRVWVLVMSMKCEVELRLREWLVDIFVT